MPGPRRGVGRLRPVILGGMAALMAWAAPSTARATGVPPVERASAEAIKATFLYKFIPFVDWPPAAFASSEEAIRLCVLTPETVGDLVERAVAGERPGGRVVEVVRIQTPAAALGCHVLYVGRPDRPGAVELLRAVGTAPILTVTDGPPPRGVPSVVAFALVNDRIGFHIDDLHAARSGLGLSSKLLSLALSVTSRRRSP